MSKLKSLALAGLSAFTMNTSAVADTNSTFNIEEFQNKIATDIAIGICKKYDEEFENQKILCKMNLCEDERYNLNYINYINGFDNHTNKSYRYGISVGGFIFKTNAVLESIIPKDNDILKVNTKYIITVLNKYTDEISDKVMKKIRYSNRGCVGVIDEGLKNGLIKIEK